VSVADRRRTGVFGAGNERRPRLPVSLLRSARPRQWAKNVLVFGAPATGGVLFEPWALRRAVLAFAAFSLASSGAYFLNDLVDRAVDGSHPTKRNRPIAAGLVSPALAAVVAIVLLGAGLVIGLVGAGLGLAAVLVGYVALTLAYTLVLRNLVLLDLAAIAGGFLLRAVAGGVAVDVPLSSWFLIVASFGSLFIAAGKRHAEYVDLGDTRASHRQTLDEYSEPYLRYIRHSSSTVAIAAYCLWAFEGAAGGPLWSGLSIIPFVLGIFRYSLLLDAGRGATPEELVLTDRPLLVAGGVWVLLVAVGVYLG
jgi:decaprenyl-phosphate phosphoribosyltransferase